MLDERKAAILRAVVEHYIETADPVGSAHVARVAGINVSPATIRNEMAVLEHEGYLTQPHTSAGRVPTDKGYRFFVDHLAAPGMLDPRRQQTVSRFFAQAHGQLERLLADTTKLVAGLTDYAAVVVGPHHESTTVRSVQLVQLAPRAVLCVVVLANGVIERRDISLADDVDEAVVAEASAELARRLVGRALGSASDVPAAPGPSRPLVESAVAALGGGSPSDDDQVYVGGVARVARAFDAVETVREILATLEQQFVVVTLLRDLIDRGLSVAIGTEHGVEPLTDCSVVVAPYEVDGEQVGTIGVLGPTRMHYPEALATVAVVSQQLSRRLSEG